MQMVTDRDAYPSAARDPLPDAPVETARTVTDGVDGDGTVIGERHRERPHVGVQFHPEGALTDEGKTLLAAFLETYA